MAPLLFSVDQIIDIAVENIKLPTEKSIPALEIFLRIVACKLDLLNEKIKIDITGESQIKAEPSIFDSDSLNKVNEQVQHQQQIINENTCEEKNLNDTINNNERKVFQESSLKPDDSEHVKVWKKILDKSDKNSSRVRSVRQENVYDQNENEQVQHYNVLIQTMDENQNFHCQYESLETPVGIDDCDPDNELVSRLLGNHNFVIELMKQISCPILEEINNWKNQMRLLGESFQKFKKRAEEEFGRQPAPEDNAIAICVLRKKFDEFMENFVETMKEVQLMMNGKLDKMHIVEMKQYIEDELKAIHEELHRITATENCPDAVGTTKGIFENVICLSCAGTVCQRSKPRKSYIFPKTRGGTVIHKETQKDAPKSIPKRTCGGSHTRIQPEERVFRFKNLADEFNVKIMEPNMRFVQGIDGKLYRGEPEVPICICEEDVKKDTDLPENFEKIMENKEGKGCERERRK